MRVAAFLMSYPPDRMVGAELMSSEFLEALVDAGHEVTVYADLISEAYERNGVHVKSRKAFNKIKRSADLIYSHPDLGSIGYIVSQLHQIPYVAVVHNTGSLNAWHLAHHKPTLTIWNSESTRTTLKGEGGLVVRSPIKVADHKVKPGKAFTLVNLCKDKGVDTFTALVEKLDFPALAVAGGYGLQEIDQVKKSGATPIPPVQFSDMPPLVWSKTKILLMPSAAESWGRAGVEALCSGIPVIAHPTPGLKESLGSAGIFIDRDDHDAWADEVSKLMTDDAYYAAASKKASARGRALEKQTATDLALFLTACEKLTQPQL